MKTAKQVAIERCAVFLVDRVTYAVETGDRKHTTKEAIQSLLESEFAGVVEVEEDDGR